MTIREEAIQIAQGWQGDPLSLGLLILFIVVAVVAFIAFESQS